MKIFPFKATHPNFELIASPESFFDNVKSEYRSYKENGFYEHDEEKAFHVYTIEKNGKTHSGIIAITDIDDMLIRGRIRKHEKTIVTKEQTMMHLMLHRQAMVKPVLLCFPSISPIDKLLKKLIAKTKVERKINFKSNGETHIFRKIKDKKLIVEIQDLFEKHLKRTYIGDGHHRASTMSILYGNQRVPGAKEKFNKVLTAYFPFSEISIESYNRVVELGEEMSAVRFMAELSKYMKVTPIDSPRGPLKKHQLMMYLNHEWYDLQWKPKALKEFGKYKIILDSGLFNSKILQSILNIEDIRFDTRLKYISGTKGAKGLMKLTNVKENQAGFCLPSVKSEEIISIVDEGRTLPPKSTWFLPRLRSGIIVKEFDDQ